MTLGALTALWGFSACSESEPVTHTETTTTTEEHVIRQPVPTTTTQETRTVHY
jgi:hypothetical protein